MKLFHLLALWQIVEQKESCIYTLIHVRESKVRSLMSNSYIMIFVSNNHKMLIQMKTFFYLWIFDKIREQIGKMYQILLSQQLIGYTYIDFRFYAFLIIAELLYLRNQTLPPPSETNLIQDDS